MLLETHTLRLNVGGDDDKDVKNEYGSDDDVNALSPRLHHKKIGEISLFQLTLLFARGWGAQGPLKPK